MSYANSGRFEYNFTRQNQFEQLRQSYVQLQKQNNQLRSSLQQLLQVHQQLTQRLEQLQSINQDGQNAQEMQQKIQLLTEEVETLRRQIQQVQCQKSKTSNRRDSNAAFQQKQRTEQVVQILEQLTKSFQNVQVNYQNQIDQLQKDTNNLKSQWGGNFKKLQQQYSQKIHTFEDVIIQLKRKDELVSLIQDKLRMSEDALRAIKQGSYIEKPNLKTQTRNTNQIGRDQAQQNGIKRPQSMKSEERQNFLQQIQQKNRVIKTYQELIMKLRQKLQQKC